MHAQSALMRIALASLVMVGACGDDNNNNVISGELDRCVQPVDIVSNVGGATRTDPNLVNAWGIAVERGAFAIVSNGGGVLAMYNADGTPASTAIPNGLAIGQGYSGIARGNNDTLVLVSENGQISFINPNVDPHLLQVVVDNSASGAVYKGVAVFDNTILAANFSQAQVEVYDLNFNLISTTQFATPPTVPAGFAPFNVAVIDNEVFVTYAQQNADKTDDVAGAGLGFLAAFTLDGTLEWTIGGAPFNAPWGMALAPAGMGNIEGALLVGNFGDGRITIVDRGTHAVLGQLVDINGAPIVVDGLWGLSDGTGVTDARSNSIYFTAGPADETQGLFGVLEPCP